MSSMSSIVFKNDNEMRSHFGIPNVVRYQPFEKYYTIRMLLDGCLQVGDRLFTNIVNTIGFVLLMILMVVVTYKDILRLLWWWRRRRRLNLQ